MIRLEGELQALTCGDKRNCRAATGQGLLLWLLLLLREVLLSLVSRLVVAGWYVALVAALPLITSTYYGTFHILKYFSTDCLMRGSMTQNVALSISG